ncbi:class F sortase [Saccharomonospora piscinae]|uniref:class F sortase n=1 Tax=Saccharomonospora piscinae TaxID=687388 RepID=UPI0011071672|nr:class F sortase [Saccharomonospora piscinae]TLW90397.1 class F sortase [Saccharomonospora piscinae]
MAAEPGGARVVSTGQEPGRAARPSRHPVRVALVALALVAVPLLWWSLRPEAAGPDIEPVGEAAAGALTAGHGSPAPPVSGAPTVPTEPVEVTVPALDLAAPVVGVGTTDTGLAEIPEHVGTAGWYSPGPRPGSATGSAVLVGHVNDVEQGPGAFARLAETAPGDRVEVRTRTGAVLAFRVIAREQWDKADVPLPRLFDVGGSPRLVLLTCGGVLDQGTGQYQDNIAVTAVPLGGGPR